MEEPVGGGSNEGGRGKREDAGRHGAVVARGFNIVGYVGLLHVREMSVSGKVCKCKHEACDWNDRHVGTKQW